MLSHFARCTALAAVAATTLAWSAAADAAVPTISGSPDPGTVVNYAYRFAPTARDADGQRLTFSISNKPGWATFDRGTGVLAGTPKSTGTFSNIVIKVSDGKNTAKLPAFRITVYANKGPSISGTPAATASVGSTYTFQPGASDPDHEPKPLSFSITGKPAWATFSTSTGRLSGTPTTAGTFAGICITVSDGQKTASLPAFAIAVQGAGSYSATLQWTAPTRNTDGTAITDLAGYRVSYGQSPGNYATTIDIGSSAITSVAIESLRAGQYYFAVRAVNSAGAVSDFSSEVSKVL